MWAEEAIRNFERYSPEIRKQVEDYARGRQEAIGASGASSGSGPAPALGGNERAGQGSPDRTNTVGDSAAAANTQTTVADIANEYLERLARGNNPLEGRGYAGLSAQNTRTLAEIADFVRSSPIQLRSEQQASIGKSGGGQPAQQPAKSDTGQRGDQLTASPGARGDGTPEPVGGNQPNAVNGATEYPSSVLEGNPNLTTNSAIALDQILDIARDEKQSKTQVLQNVKEWATNMLAQGEPPQEVRDAYNLFSSLPQLHKSTTKAVDTILKKAEKAQGKQPADTAQRPAQAATLSAEQKILQALEGVGNFETLHAINLERAEQGSLLDAIHEKAQEDNLTREEIERREWDAEQERKAEERTRLARIDSALWEELTPIMEMVHPDVKLSAKDKVAAKSSIETALNNAVNAGLPRDMAEQRVQFLYEMLGTKPQAPTQKPAAKKEQPAQPKNEIEYAQNRAEVLQQIDALPGEALTEGRRALFPDKSWPNAVERVADIMWDKAAGKPLTEEEAKIYKKLRKLGIKEVDPVVTENAKAAAEQGKKLDMKTTEQGQATITRRNARKKVNDQNSETCGLG